MAHLSISSRCSFNKLVDMYIEYGTKALESTDVFEKAEYKSFVSEIEEFAEFRNGYNYLQRLKNEVHAREPRLCVPCVYITSGSMRNLANYRKLN